MSRLTNGLRAEPFGPRAAPGAWCPKPGARAGGSPGYSLVELMFVAGILATVVGVSVPLLLSTLDAARTHGAARYLSGRLNLARMEAVKRSVNVAVRFEGRNTEYRYTVFADGNDNGVRTRDISSGIDRPIGAPERVGDKFSAVVFGILDGVVGIDDSAPLDSGDPIRLGSSDLLSFSPIGSSTAGTLYLHGRGKQQAAVRVLGATGRVRVLYFDFRMRKWLSP